MWRAWLCLIGWIEREQLRSSALPGSQVSSFAICEGSGFDRGGKPWGRAPRLICQRPSKSARDRAPSLGGERYDLCSQLEACGGAAWQSWQYSMLDGLCGPMTLPQTVPLMSPGAGCAHSSSLTSLHHPRQCHRQLAVLACNASIPLVPTALADSGRRGAQRSEVKEEAEGRGTRTELSAMSA